MVAVIHTSKSLRNVLNYNEQKVAQKKAACIAASGYPKEASKMNFYQKLARLQNQAALNVRTTVNSVHISLNFTPGERLTQSSLQEIADNYMQKIGFGDQPYLVYQHNDAGHPHLHIVTTNIKADGKRIELHNLGRNQSEKARKEIERDFNLVRADTSQKKQGFELTPLSAQKLHYGKSETRRAITHVLDYVLTTYRYSSLAELNAVLKLYNLTADRGSEDSRTFQNNGLVYRVLDQQGKKVGVPIKASLIHTRPTLAYLEKQFTANRNLKQEHKQRLKTVIDWCMRGKEPTTLSVLIKALEKERINVILRENKEGLIYGITFIDHRSKVVLNGSDLGKGYSAKALQERCKPDPTSKSQTPHQYEKQNTPFRDMKTDNSIVSGKDDKPAMPESKPTLDFVPVELKKPRRKKKRRIKF